MNFVDSLTGMARQPPEAEDYPIWFDEKKIDEVLFCQGFLRVHPMICVRGAFFTVDGRRCIHSVHRINGGGSPPFFPPLWRLFRPGRQRYNTAIGSHYPKTYF